MAKNKKLSKICDGCMCTDCNHSKKAMLECKRYNKLHWNSNYNKLADIKTVEPTKDGIIIKFVSVDNK